MYRLPRNSYEFNTDPNKGIDYILSAIRGLQSGGVSQIIAGTNVTISPVSGTGAVTINASGGGSIPTLDQVTTAGNTTANGISIGSLAVDTDLIYTDAVNNRVGIGTTTPFGKLDVKDGEIFVTTSTNANLRSRLTYQGLYVSRSVDGSYTEQIISTNTAWQYHSRNNHVFYRDGSRYFQIGTTGASAYLTLNTTGNVLIGTTTDAGYKLQVNGDATINGVRVGLGGGGVADNTVLGFEALPNNTSGTAITAVGYQALRANSTGVNNTAVGYWASYSNTAGRDNTAIGRNALRYNTTGNYNTGIGSGTLTSLIGGGNNTAIGTNVLAAIVNQIENTAVGSNSQSNSTGQRNTSVGSYSLTNNTTGSTNVAIGGNSLQFNIAGSSNTALGHNSLRNNTASNNTAVGFEAGYSNTTGTDITAIGYQSLRANTTGAANVGVGTQTLYSNTTGEQNTAIGRQALRLNTTGGYNSAVGFFSLYNNTTGSQSVAHGHNALYANTIGSYNTAIGASSLRFNVDGMFNTAIGQTAGYSNVSGSNNVFIGRGAGYNETGSDKLYIGNSSTNTLIYGDFSTGNVSIGSTVDAGYKLDVNGSVRVVGSIKQGHPTFIGINTIEFSADEKVRFHNSGIGEYLVAGPSNIVSTSAQRLQSVVRGSAFGYTTNGVSSAIEISSIPVNSSGTVNSQGIWIKYAINNTGTYSGIARGIYYNPTLTSLTGTTHRAIETTSGDVIFGSSSGSVIVADSSISLIKYGATPKLYVNGGTYLKGVTQIGTNQIYINGNNITWEATGIANNLPEWRADATGIKFGNYLSLPLRISVNGVENARFFSTGNVSIGSTVDAGYKLDVNGNIRIQNTSNTLFATDNTRITNGGTLYFGPYTSTNSSYLSYNELKLYGNSNIGNSAGQLIVSSTGNLALGAGSTNRIFINSSTGNVGIYTSNPLAKLHVVGNIIAQLTNSTQSDVVYYDSTTGELTYGASPAGATPTLDAVTTAGNTTTNNITAAEIVATSHFKLQNGGKLYSNASSVTLQSAASNPILFNVSTTEVARIASTGNLLLGTTTDAGYKLDVNGNIRTSGTINVDGNNGTGGQIFLKNSAGDYITQIGTSSYDLYLQTRGTGNVIKFRFGSSARELRFQGGGTGDIQVIGDGASWAANGIRDIRHGSDAITITSSNYNGGDGVVIDRGRSTVSTDPIISFKDYGVEKARINRAGNVGIGTTAPSSKLQLGEDASTLGSNVFTMYRGGSTGQYTTIENQGGTVYKSYGVGGHVFYHDPSQEAMRVAATTGNLLVGTTTDAGYKLDVQGGDARFAQNVEAASYSVAGNAGYSGIINFPGNPPGSQNLEFLQGILINVF